MMKLIDYLAEKQLDLRFKKLVKAGLLARDVVAVQLLGEKRKRLALLCKSKKQVYAVICVNAKKSDVISIFTFIGHYLQAKKGVVLSKKQEWVSLSGRYEGLRAPLVVAEDVSARSWANHAS